MGVKVLAIHNDLFINFIYYLNLKISELVCEDRLSFLQTYTKIQLYHEKVNRRRKKT